MERIYGDAVEAAINELHSIANALEGIHIFPEKIKTCGNPKGRAQTPSEKLQNDCFKTAIETIRRRASELSDKNADDIPF